MGSHPTYGFEPYLPPVILHVKTEFLNKRTYTHSYLVLSVFSLLSGYP